MRLTLKLYKNYERNLREQVKLKMLQLLKENRQWSENIDAIKRISFKQEISPGIKSQIDTSSKHIGERTLKRQASK